MVNDHIPFQDLNIEILNKIQQNDPGFLSLRIREEQWIKGIGSAIGNSKFLKRLEIITSGKGNGDKKWLREVLHGLAQNRTLEVLVLSMSDHNSSLDIFYILHPFFKDNVCFRHFEVYEYEGVPKAVTSLVSALSKCRKDQLRVFKFDKVFCTDRQAVALFDSLREQTALTHLGFTYNTCIGEAGWTALATLLKNPASKIEFLDLCLTDLDDDSITILGNALVNSNALVKLRVLLLNGLKPVVLFQQGPGNTLIIDVKRNGPTLLAPGWRAVSSLVSHPTCSLGHLSLSQTKMSEEGVSMLGNALSVNNTIEFLDLSENIFITVAGWREFSECLRNPKSALAELNLSQCKIGDKGACVLVRALENNSSLKIMDLSGNNGIKDRFWKVLIHVLGYKSSITATYSSNHTLCTLKMDGSDDQGLRKAAFRLLNLNENEDKVKVARQKIMRYHFHSGTKHHLRSGRKENVHAILPMPETVLPFAFEYVGRSGLEFSLMYRVVRSFPSLFENHAS